MVTIYEYLVIGWTLIHPRFTRVKCGHDYKWRKSKGRFLTMGSKIVGLARIEALIENLKRDLALSSTTLTGATWSNGVFNSDQQFTCSGNVAFTGTSPLLQHQGSEETLADDTAIVAKGAFKKRLAKCTPGAARAKATDTAANIISECALDNDGDSFEFTIINLATVAARIITLSGGTDVTIVGSALVFPNTGGEAAGSRDSVGSATFRVRRTSSTEISMYRIA